MITLAERQYHRLVEDIMENGNSAKPTKGGCSFVVGKQIELPPEEVPLLQGRKIFYKGLVGELKAFIANERTQAGFARHGCNFWGEWANDDGTLDVDYARLLHDFNNVNQLDRLIDGIQDEPHSRKHIISLWDPSSKAKQVPCVLSYQFIVVGDSLQMIWTQRSVDVMVGLASDMFSAWLFNQVIAASVGLLAGTVTMNLGHTHIYDIHREKVSEYIDGIWAADLMTPTWSLDGRLYDFEFDLRGYNPDNIVKFELLT